VLSHLGAVVNFAAGSLARAPRWMRRAGLEWAWRVKEEPGLWRRYASDGLKLGSLLVDHVVPDRFAVRIGPKPTTTPTGVAVSTTDDATTIALRGSWRGDVTAVRRALAECAEGENRVVFDLRGVSDVGAPFVALLMLANGWFRGRAGMTVVGVSQAVFCEFRRKMADHVL
jgi:N-acetylglucosaminyldiphosphoundecaprenol N-acetyl-beta-D-mannosaminyltransferase